MCNDRVVVGDPTVEAVDGVHPWGRERLDQGGSTGKVRSTRFVHVLSEVDWTRVVEDGGPMCVHAASRQVDAVNAPGYAARMPPMDKAASMRVGVSMLLHAHLFEFAQCT